MSKVIVSWAAQKKTLPVSDDVVTTGWLPGQVFNLTTDGLNVELANVDGAMFVDSDVYKTKLLLIA